MVSSTTHYKVWDETTCPYPNVNDANFEVWELMNDAHQVYVFFICWRYVILIQFIYKSERYMVLIRVSLR